MEGLGVLDDAVAHTLHFDQYNIRSSLSPNPLSTIKYGPQHMSLLPLHPNADKFPIYWAYFKANCHLIRIFHLPTIESMVLHITNQLDCISNSEQMLLFALYFAVVVSLSKGECLRILGGERDLLLRLYRYAIDQSLAQAQFQETNEPIIIQALFVFLSSLKHHCNSHLIWDLTSITVQLAKKISLHRDGGYSPFFTEMRRRLWWGVSWLDARACEDSGYPSMVQAADVNTQLPLNVDDCELHPSMPLLPKSRSDWTEMTFSRSIFEAVVVFHRLTASSNKDITRSKVAEITRDISNRNSIVAEYQGRLEQILSTSNAVDSAATEYASIATWITLNKLWLLAYYPYLLNGSSIHLPQNTRRSLLLISIYVMEMSSVLQQQKRFRQWRWLTESYAQCDALTYILLELCLNSEEDLVERAWNIINQKLGQSAVADHKVFPNGMSEGREFGHSTNAKNLCTPENELLNRLLRRARLAKGNRADVSKSDTCIQEIEPTAPSASDLQTTNDGGVVLSPLDTIPASVFQIMVSEFNQDCSISEDILNSLSQSVASPGWCNPATEVLLSTDAVIHTVGVDEYSDLVCKE